MHHQFIFDPFLTLQYVYLFAAGAVLALHAKDVRGLFSAAPAPLKMALWLITLFFVTYPANKNLGLFVCGMASISLVALCFADEVADRYLSSPVPMWLGRVSYSLYLLHVPILDFVLHNFYGTVPLIGLIALAVGLSLVAAELAYRFVERPAIALGRRLTSKPLMLPSPVKVGSGV